MSHRDRVQMLLQDIRGSNSSDFYRNLWGTSLSFKSLPHITREDFMRTALSLRRYKEGGSLVKIVRDNGRPFLSEWSYSDIGAQRYGSPSVRPMVAFRDSHEALEKSAWCYENRVLPLVAEHNSEISLAAAAAYRIDSLICDEASLIALRPYLASAPQKLSSVDIIGSSFNYDALSPYAAYAEHVRLVFALPETGAVADALLGPRPTFSVFPDYLIENEQTLVITNTRLLVTPIIRYDTRIRAHDISFDDDTIRTFSL